MIRSTVSVTGIVKDWEQNSDFGFKDLISYNTIAHSFLQQDMSVGTVANQCQRAGKAVPRHYRRAGGKAIAAFYQRHRHLPDEIKVAFSLQPLADIHFNARNYDTYGRRAYKPH